MTWPAKGSKFLNTGADLSSPPPSTTTTVAPCFRSRQSTVRTPRAQIAGKIECQSPIPDESDPKCRVQSADDRAPHS